MNITNTCQCCGKKQFTKYDLTSFLTFGLCAECLTKGLEQAPVMDYALPE